jgi:hypothetical protein
MPAEMVRQRLSDFYWRLLHSLVDVNPDLRHFTERLWCAFLSELWTKIWSWRCINCQGEKAMTRLKCREKKIDN